MPISGPALGDWLPAVSLSEIGSQQKNVTCIQSLVNIRMWTRERLVVSHFSSPTSPMSTEKPLKAHQISDMRRNDGDPPHSSL